MSQERDDVDRGAEQIAQQRRSYRPPRLESLGTIQALTAGDDPAGIPDIEGSGVRAS